MSSKENVNQFSTLADSSEQHGKYTNSISQIHQQLHAIYYQNEQLPSYQEYTMQKMQRLTYSKINITSNEHKQSYNAIGTFPLPRNYHSEIHAINH